jgi:hypothetical protein
MSTNPLLQSSPYAEDRGNLIGRDPRKLSLDAISVPPMLAAQAIRAKCLDCCGDQPGEVRKCVATGCPLWAFRMTGRLPPKLKAAALGKDADDDAPQGGEMAPEVVA